jgi:hypothetical protein
MIRSATLLVTISSTVLVPRLGPAEEPPKPEAVERMARESAIAERPKLNPTTKFRIVKCEIEGLWDALKCEVYSVELLGADGTPFSSYCGLYHDGTLRPILKDFGGYGLMSATMHEGTLYGSYSWGSGLHRSHLFALTIADGKPKLRESGGFASKDLFVSVGKDGTLAVQAGKYESFNKWTDGADFGMLSIVEKELNLVDADGAVIDPEIALRNEDNAKR